MRRQNRLYQVVIDRRSGSPRRGLSAIRIGVPTLSAFIAVTNRAIYHITHADNLAQIVLEGRLWCDAQRIARGLANTNIGYSHIKARRMRHPVTVAAGGTLGEYVPFNFCPRSVMLYVVAQGHENYREGQRAIKDDKREEEATA